MRKMMAKEVTHTTVQIAKVTAGEGGVPVVEALPSEVLIGNVSLEKAQKEMTAKHAGVTVFGVNAETQTYEMSVEDFLKHATLKVAEQPGEATQEQTA